MSVGCKITHPIVSIIMPAYNAEKYIGLAIQSVINQTYNNWELLIINDGSLDNTNGAVNKYLTNSKIRYYQKENGGVGSARNIGLKEMKGDFFCFLDSDDVMPPNSLESRLAIFENDTNICFVDGVVKKFNGQAQDMTIISTWSPNFRGEPLKDLVRLGGKSFLGLTWMIRREAGMTYAFNEELSHSEDLQFFINLAQAGKLYSYTSNVVLLYRQSDTSAMTNIDGLANGYLLLRKYINGLSSTSLLDKVLFSIKIKKILFLSYFRLSKDYAKAFKILFR